MRPGLDESHGLTLHVAQERVRGCPTGGGPVQDQREAERTGGAGAKGSSRRRRSRLSRSPRPSTPTTARELPLAGQTDHDRIEFRIGKALLQKSAEQHRFRRF